jgi:hypothetical protein
LVQLAFDSLDRLIGYYILEPGGRAERLRKLFEGYTHGADGETADGMALEKIDRYHSPVDMAHGMASHLWIEEPGERFTPLTGARFGALGVLFLSSEAATSRCSSPFAASMRIRSPVRTRASGPPAAASGDT